MKKVKVDIKKTKIALKPYLDTIAEYCGALSTKELTDVIISLAKDVPTSARVPFLEKIESCLPGRKSAVVPEADQILNVMLFSQCLSLQVHQKTKCPDLMIIL